MALPPGTTVSFFPGETTKTVTVTVNGDTAVEADEVFYVRLSSPSGAVLARVNAKGTILNDDP